MSLSPRDLGRIAARVAGNPAFCGWVLARYAESEGVDPAEVARRLGATAEAIGHLHLCLRPSPERFLADVRQIADHVNIDADALAAVVRRVDVLERMRAGPATTASGTLLAARARKPLPRKPTPRKPAARRRKDAP